jgi:hypothetical protein
MLNPSAAESPAFGRHAAQAALSADALPELPQVSPPGITLEEFAAVDESTSDTDLLRELYALRFDPENTPPPDEVCMTIGGTPIAARGNLTGIQGKSKVGKSSVVAALLGAAMRSAQMFPPPGDTLQIEWSGEAGGAVLHLDTEQSRADWHALMMRAIRRSGLASMPGRVVSIPLVMLSRSDRKKALRLVLEHEQKDKGGIDLVVIDGGADIIQSPNDEAESLEVVSWLMALAQEFHCAIVIIIHENPSSEDGKTRGHFGSELNRKAFANLRIDKDTDGVSTIYGTDMRKRDIPKVQGFCFAWDEAAGMHSYKGRHNSLKAATREEKNVAKAREEWTSIFERAAEMAEEIGTNPNVPALSPETAAVIERDISGTETATKTDTMKKRMQRAETLGVLRKSGPGVWELNPSGHAGQTWDN